MLVASSPYGVHFLPRYLPSGLACLVAVWHYFLPSLLAVLPLLSFPTRRNVGPCCGLIGVTSQTLRRLGHT